MTTYEKIVKGATKIKLAAPKPKYIEPILMSTNSGINSDDFRTVVRSLHSRLQDTAWTIVYKSLIVSHLLMKEGDENVAIEYFSDHPEFFQCSNITKNLSFGPGGGDARSVIAYARYLSIRAREYKKLNYDIIKENFNNRKLHSSWSSKDKNHSNNSRLRNLTIDKGLLRNVESVQNIIDSLIRCKFQESEINNEVIITSFKLLTSDLLTLYQSLNEGIINILEHFFELSKPDSERALEIYKKFTKETTEVVAFLRIAKHLEYATKMSIPTIKHAQTGLTSSLEEYVNDTNFESNRRQYLAEKSIKENSNKNGSSTNASTAASNATGTAAATATASAPGFAYGNPDLFAQQSAVYQQQQQFLNNLLTQQQIFTGNTPNTPQQDVFSGSSPFYQSPQSFVQPQPTMNQSPLGVSSVDAALSFQNTGYNPFAQPQYTQQPQPQMQQQQQQPSLIEDFNKPQAQPQQGLQQPFGTIPLPQQQTQQQPQPQFSTITGFSQQANVPAAQPQSQVPLNNMYTGAGFGGYGTQVQQAPTGSMVQQQPQQQQQQTQFQQNGLLNNPTGLQLPSTTSSIPPPLSSSGITPMRTGNVTRSNTNPFALKESSTMPITSNQTGSNNPFGQARYSSLSQKSALSFSRPDQLQSQVSQPMVQTQATGIPYQNTGVFQVSNYSNGSAIPPPQQQQQQQQQPPQQQQQQQQQQFQPLQSYSTGTNPFSMGQPATTGTTSSNPFGQPQTQQGSFF